MKEKEVINMQKARREGREYTTHALRYISRPVSRMIIKHTKITPNQVTMLSFLMGITGGIFLILGGRQNQLIGVSFALAYVLFDLMDGEIARVREMTSLFGKWIDGVVGTVMTPFLIFSLAFGMNNYLAMVIGSIAMVCFPIQYALIYYYKFDIVKNEERIYLGKFSSLRRLYGSITFYPLLFIFVLLNLEFYLLLFYAVFGNLFWLLVLITQYLSFKKKVETNEKVD